MSDADWNMVRFSELLAGPVRNGVYKSKGYHGRGAKVVNMGELFTHSRLFDVPMKRVELNESEISRFLLEEGDLIFARRSLTAAGAGKCSIVMEVKEPTTFESSIIRARPNRTRANPLFLYYFFQSSAGFQLLDTIRRQVAVAGITGGDLSQLLVPTPSLQEQEAIASACAALDDKIELNRRMNETLEAMAQAIFRDWFVDFGPVRRKMEGATDPVAIMGGLTPDPARAAELAALFPAAMGEDGLPEEWSSSTVGAAFNITMGQSPPGETYNETGVGLPFFQGRTDFGFRYPERRKYCSAPSRIADPDDTLISVRAPVGDLNVAWERCCVGRGVAAARHKLGGKSYTFYAMRSLQPELKSFEHTGTVFGAINKRQLEQLAIAEPPEVLVRSFETLVGPMDDRIRSSVAESRTLAETRDYLLPRLMSGQVRVGDAAVVEAHP